MPAQVGEQIDRGMVGPVHVVEKQHDRAEAGGFLQEVAELAQQGALRRGSRRLRVVGRPAARGRRQLRVPGRGDDCASGAPPRRSRRRGAGPPGHRSPAGTPPTPPAARSSCRGPRRHWPGPATSARKSSTSVVLPMPGSPAMQTNDAAARVRLAAARCAGRPAPPRGARWAAAATSWPTWPSSLSAPAPPGQLPLRRPSAAAARPCAASPRSSRTARRESRGSSAREAPPGWRRSRPASRRESRPRTDVRP